MLMLVSVIKTPFRNAGYEVANFIQSIIIIDTITFIYMHKYLAYFFILFIFFFAYWGLLVFSCTQDISCLTL